ncbi:MAG: bestrophin family ion channel [Acidobacteria bacterium]|nr:bestrophin family ion channel [Acidobacteriota bacterium]
MISYDPHKWLSHFFDLRGSMFREIIGRVLLCVAWAAAVVCFDKYVVDVNISSLLHALTGSALGLLLVFRTNASYDRFWEGRKLWGGIVNETRNLIRSASVHLAGERDLLVSLTELTASFPPATMHQLRGTKMPGMLEVQHPPLLVATQMTAILKEAQRRGAISDILLANLDQNIQQLIDYNRRPIRLRR